MRECSRERDEAICKEQLAEAALEEEAGLTTFLPQQWQLKQMFIHAPRMRLDRPERGKPSRAGN